MKDQHLPTDASSTALSPGYIADFDPEEDLEKDSADYLQPYHQATLLTTLLVMIMLL
nr:hypothetical protein [Tanacetum cinerariifolium]